VKHLYSIIISTKNNELTIGYVLRSTLIIANRYDTELIVVDGNSVDDTPKVVSEFVSENRQYYTSLKVLKDPGFSLSLARHLGFKNSQGDVLIFLDGDTLLTDSFKFNLEKELEDADLITPMCVYVPLDKATKVFCEFVKVASCMRANITRGKGIGDPSILLPARIYKREVLEKLRGYPVSSRFSGEDRIATALAVRLGYCYRFSSRLKLLKIDDPGYYPYWKKHFRYSLGIHKDVTPLGKSILRGYIIARRISHLNVILPIISLIYALNSYRCLKSFSRSINVALMKYFVDTAMFLGDLIGVLTGR